jgi:hypothetical protein
MEEYPNLEPHKAPQSPKKEYKDTSSITYLGPGLPKARAILPN